jgi:two-component system CheB/CheR fusion protein
MKDRGEKAKNKILLEYSNSIIATLREPFLVLDKKLRIISTNKSFYSIFRVNEKDTIGQSLTELGNGQWNIPKLLVLLKKILPEKKTVENFEVDHKFEHIGYRIMNLNAHQLRISKNIAALVAASTRATVSDAAEELILLAIEDITDRKEAERKLKTLDQVKSQFVANVAHEFKSPLSIIKESLAQILEGLSGEINPEQKEILNRQRRTIDRLIHLVTNLLDISKIESGKMMMRREEFDIAPLIDEILVTYEAEISKKQIVFKKDIPQDIGSLWADREMLTQVIINLLTNAIKYTPAQRDINVSISGTKTEMRFEISDTGPGIPREYLDKIFDKFERINTEKQEGTGLGLPIAKDIVGLHKGRIWIESEIGKGSKFIFTLPRSFRKQ